MAGEDIPLGCYLDLDTGFEGCHCAQAGDACDRPTPLCLGEESQAACIDGTWQVDSCADVCGSADAICVWGPALSWGKCDC
jgi:hypothetical protein